MSSAVNETVTGSETPTVTVRVWDPLVRVFHWSLVFLFAFAFLTGDEWEDAHEMAGYLVAGLIAFRLVWGLVGSKHARFSDFVYHPAAAISYMADSARQRAKRYLGHNPAGGWMVIALLVAISTICITGYLMTTNAFWGVEWLEEMHEVAAYGTLMLIGLHVLGVVIASIEHRENLVMSMISGCKRVR